MIRTIRENLQVVNNVPVAGTLVTSILTASAYNCALIAKVYFASAKDCYQKCTYAKILILNDNEDLREQAKEAINSSICPFCPEAMKHAILYTFLASVQTVIVVTYIARRYQLI